MTIASQSGIPITKSTGVGTIVNDDQAPPAPQTSLAFSDDTLTLMSGATADVFLTLTPPAGVTSFLRVFTTANGVVSVPDFVEINATGTGKLTVIGLAPGVTNVGVTFTGPSGPADAYFSVRVIAPARRRGVSH